MLLLELGDGIHGSLLILLDAGDFELELLDCELAVRNLLPLGLDGAVEGVQLILEGCEHLGLLGNLGLDRLELLLLGLNCGLELLDRCAGLVEMRPCFCELLTSCDDILLHLFCAEASQRGLHAQQSEAHRARALQSALRAVAS